MNRTLIKTTSNTKYIDAPKPIPEVFEDVRGHFCPVCSNGDLLVPYVSFLVYSFAHSISASCLWDVDTPLIFSPRMGDGFCMGTFFFSLMQWSAVLLRFWKNNDESNSCLHVECTSTNIKSTLFHFVDVWQEYSAFIYTILLDLLSIMLNRAMKGMP